MQRNVAEALAHNSDVQPPCCHAAPPHGRPAATPRGTPQPSRVAKRFIASVGCTMRSCKAKRFDTTVTRRRPGSSATQPQRGRPQRGVAEALHHNRAAWLQRGSEAEPLRNREAQGLRALRRGSSESSSESRARGGRGAHGPGGARVVQRGGVGSGSSEPPDSSLIPPFPAFRALRGGPPCVYSEREAPAGCSREQGHPPRKSGKGGISEGCGGRAHGSPPSRLRPSSVVSLRVVVTPSLAARLCASLLSRLVAPTQVPCQAAHSRHASRAMLPCKRNTCICRVSVVK